jgi:hypothetical protein
VPPTSTTGQCRGTAARSAASKAPSATAIPAAEMPRYGPAVSIASPPPKTTITVPKARTAVATAVHRAACWSIPVKLPELATIATPVPECAVSALSSVGCAGSWTPSSAVRLTVSSDGMIIESSQAGATV